MKGHTTHTVTIIGAGAAGIGLGVIFEKMGFTDYVIVEKDTVGSSFKKWHDYTRFISPSFAGNAFNAVDLNAITPDTSPAYTLETEHPSGKQYAGYLQLVADHFALNIKEHTTVTTIEKHDEQFLIHTSDDVLRSQFVVWAGGEFQYPDTSAIPGAEYCIHSAQVQVEDIDDDTVTIIGGYESGMELALHLCKQGKKVTVIDSGLPWDVQVSDASIALSTYTKDRLRSSSVSKNITLVGNTAVTKITKEKEGYAIHSSTSQPIHVPTAPILATGFANLPPVVDSLFDSTAEGHIAITDDDESTTTANLFLAGPKVRHGGAIFCFIYKFRQRLPIIAETIADRIGHDTRALEEYKQAGLYLKDLSCCTDECAC